MDTIQSAGPSGFQQVALVCGGSWKSRVAALSAVASWRLPSNRPGRHAAGELVPAERVPSQPVARTSSLPNMTRRGQLTADEI